MKRKKSKKERGMLGKTRAGQDRERHIAKENKSYKKVTESKKGRERKRQKGRSIIHYTQCPFPRKLMGMRYFTPPTRLTTNQM